MHDLEAHESHRIRKQMIHKVRAAMQISVYGAEKVSTRKHTQFRVHLQRGQSSSTTWSNADLQKEIWQLECEIHPVTAKWKDHDKLFQCH
jgi:hypothetical protein